MPATSAIPGNTGNPPHEQDDENRSVPTAADSPPAKLESHPNLIACEECDLVFERREPGCHELARCPRCSAVVERGHRLGLEGQLAMAVAALVVFLLANCYPIITLDLRGARSAATVAGALIETWSLDQELVAVIAGFTAVIAPAMVILLRLYVTGSLAVGIVPPFFGQAMYALRISARWSMVEVFMLGTLVSIVRVAGLASVIPGPGIFSFGVLTMLLASIEAAGMHGLWESAGSIRAGKAPE